VTFAVTGPSSTTAGQSFDLTVTAKDQFNNTATGYTGSVHFTSSDGHVTLPADSPFATADQGVRTFVASAVLKTSGPQTITATDTANPTVTGTSATITVNPGNATVLVVTAPAALETAGTPFNVTVEARDGYSNTVTAYVGPIHFDITDPKVTPLTDYTFVPATDHGIHTFSVTLHSAGQWTVKATDVGAGFYGISGTITVQPGAPAKLAFQTQPGNTVVGGAVADFTVAVRDADDNVVTSSSAAIAVAIGNNPAGAVLTGTATQNAVNGVATFSGLTLNKAANGYTLSASSDPLASATSAAFNVGKGAATLALSNLTYTYDGSPKSATVTTSPAGLSGVSVTYDASSTPPSNAGSYAVIASLNNPDYQATNAANTLVIAKGTSTTVVTCPATVPFTGAALEPCTANVTGAGGLTQSLTVTYTNNTTAGTASAGASFAGDANHNGSSDSKTFTIDKASSTTTVSCPASVPFTGAAQTPCTASVTGAGGLTQSLTVNHSNNTNAGTATASASYAGDGNHNSSSDSKTFTIDKAGSTTTVSCPASVTFTGAAQTPCTASVTGAGGLNQPLAVAYGNNTNAGLASASTSYLGDANHTSSSNTKYFTIAQASSTTTVSCPASVTYTGSAQTPCTASVTGAGGLTQSLTVNYSNNTIAGTASASASYSGDANHANSSDAKNFTIAPQALSIKADAKSTQYSDPLPDFTATYAGFVAGEGPGNLGGTLICTTTATASSGPGAYPITCSGRTSNNYAITYAPGVLTVTQEDARATYTGALYVSTSSATSTSATVTLSATVQDITAVIGDPDYDVYPGDIRNAKVKFINRDASPNTVIAEVPVGLVTSGDTKTGTATYNWNTSISGCSQAPCSQSITVGVEVTGYYTYVGSDDDTVVTVAQAGSNFITGGGYLVMQNPSGQYPGQVGTKANFGFNVKYNKNGTNLQGNINTIVRNGGRVYQIKGNSMTSLSVSQCSNATLTNPCTATFNGKASIQDITDPLNVISIDGNATLQVTMTDKGDPGSSDKIGITVWDKKGGLWFSSNWDGTKTVEQALGGGNLVVH
jgi:MBG domain/MBG domain (YGX type)